MDKVRIGTEHIKLGMYVSELDKPWVETPFLFQGFAVNDEDDLAELRKHCKSVVVDVEQSRLPKEEIDVLVRISYENAASPERQPSNGVVRLEKKKITAIPEPDFKRTGQYYVNTEELGKELARAQDVEKQATRAVNDVLSGVRDGQTLNVPRLQEVIDPLVDSVLRNADAMSWLIRIRETDEYVYQHSIGTSVWAIVFGRHLGFDKETLSAIGLGGMLLDIGKTKLPAELLKKPDKLSPQELIQMRKHVELGLDVLKESGNSDPRIEIMLATHHERFDGSGYPHRLQDTSIPVLGRLAGIVDSYDAMVSKRPYAKSRSTFGAMRELQALAGKGFQKEMVDQFVQAVGMFPTGSLVELNTGEVAIVTAQNNYQRLRPEIMIVLDREKSLCDDFRTVDLRMNQDDELGNEAMWIDRGLEPGSYGIDPAEYFL
jgi:HD-GYP domain-containing protein (c-di-GMP phosphodiesterase class II)